VGTKKEYRLLWKRGKSFSPKEVYPFLLNGTTSAKQIKVDSSLLARFLRTTREEKTEGRRRTQKFKNTAVYCPTPKVQNPPPKGERILLSDGGGTGSRSRRNLSFLLGNCQNHFTDLVSSKLIPDPIPEKGVWGSP